MGLQALDDCASKAIALERRALVGQGACACSSWCQALCAPVYTPM